MPTRDEQLIIPYLEGALDAKRRARIETRIDSDPRFARAVENVRRMKYVLQETAADTTKPSSDSRSAWPGVEARLHTARRSPSYGTLSLAAVSLCTAAIAGIAVFGHFSLAPVTMASDSITTPTVGASMLGHSLNKPRIVVGAPIISYLASASSTFVDGDAQYNDPHILPLHQTPLALTNMSEVAYAPSTRSLSARSQSEYTLPFVVSDGTVQSLQYDTNGSPQPANAPAEQPGITTTSTDAGSGSIGGDINGPPVALYSSGASATGAGSSLAADALDKSKAEMVETLIAAKDAEMPQNGPAAPADNDAQPNNFRLAALSSDSSPAPTQATLDSEQSLVDNLKSLSDEAKTDAQNGNTKPAVSRWVAVLTATTSSSIYGNDAAATLATQILQDAKSMGLLDAVRQQLESWQETDTDNIGVMRMLTALYQVDGDTASALSERRKAVGQSTAIGEDWFQAGLAEEQAGNPQSATADYEKALQSGSLTNTDHENIARQQIPQMDL